MLFLLSTAKVYAVTQGVVSVHKVLNFIISTVLLINITDFLQKGL